MEALLVRNAFALCFREGLASLAVGWGFGVFLKLVCRGVTICIARDLKASFRSRN